MPTESSIGLSSPVAAGPVAPGVYCLREAVDVPLLALFDYLSTVPVEVGGRVIVPFGRRKVVGVVVGLAEAPAINIALVNGIDQVLDDTPPLSADWLRMASFAA